MYVSEINSNELDENELILNKKRSLLAVMKQWNSHLYMYDLCK